MSWIDYTGPWTYPPQFDAQSPGPSGSASEHGKRSPSTRRDQSSTRSSGRSSGFPRALREPRDSRRNCLTMTQRQYRADQIWGAVITATLIVIAVLMVRSISIDREQDRVTAEIRAQQCQTYGMVADLTREIGVEPPVKPSGC